MKDTHLHHYNGTAIGIQKGCHARQELIPVAVHVRQVQRVAAAELHLAAARHLRASPRHMPSHAAPSASARSLNMCMLGWAMITIQMRSLTSPCDKYYASQSRYCSGMPVEGCTLPAMPAKRYAAAERRRTDEDPSQAGRPPKSHSAQM